MVSVRPAAWIVIVLLAALALAPLAGAQSEEEPIRCDHTPTEVVIGLVTRLQPFVDHLLRRTGETLGKARCTAYTAAFLCANETWPPPASAFTTNPTQVHNYFSPCFDLLTPGWEHLAGCPTASLLRHDFRDGSHTHRCVPYSALILPS